ncbi:MAG: leucine-rich repeat protein, partial [Bacteroidales bacterium]|nr:leucine-rich repeat protein [Bacteroidales bacterium]
MPSTIVSLEANCFRETGLVTLNIPENVTSISTTSFIDYCESLTTINVSPDNQVFASDDGILFTKSKHTILRCPTGRTGSVSVIPSVDTLGYNAFSMCHYVTDISFQGNIIYLDDAVFYDCRSLTSMTIPEGITDLPRSTFQSCSNLTQVNLPNSLVSIGNQAFYYCQHLSSFTVTENVSYIGQGVFGGCSDLQSIDVVENNQYFSSVDGVLYNKTISTLVTCPGGKRGELNIPNTVENIVSMGVMNCGYLTSVTIPNSVTDLGTYFLYNSSQIHSLTIPGSVSQIKSYAFAHCYGLQDIELEEGIQIIDNNTFISCSSLSQITLPSTVTSIGSNAFSSDYNLKVLRSNAVTVPQLNLNAFQLIGTNIAIVPCEAKQDYLANGTWSSKFIILCDDDLQSSCYHPVASFENVSITQNNPFQWRGNQVSGTGQYIDILQTQDLTCDSIIALKVSLISDTTFPCQVTAIYPFNGTFQNPFYDNVWLSDRQVINTNTSEMDERTQNQLRVIPEGSNYSFRLGNNSTGAQAEAMRFVYTVDTAISDIVIFKYAAVLQDPQHDESMQPRLTFKVSDAMGNTIDSLCTFADFRANASLGWNSIGSGSNVILWKDWTTIGLDVSQYNGQNIYLTFTTYDCGEGDHYGYAYFTLDCANKKITSDNCGNVTENTFYAPEGFEYQWYNSENPQNILSTERYLSVDQAGEYICKSSFIGNPDCFFLLSVNSGTRYPYAQFTYETEECSNGLQKVQFYNNSLVTKDEYHQILTNERCDNSYWDFGDGETSTEDNPSHWFENGSFSVTLVSSLANGQCEDEISQELNITCSDLTLAFDTVIQGGYYMDFHITQDTVIFDTLVSSLGNDSVVKHSVVTLQAIINQADTTVLCGTSEWENLTSTSTVFDTIRTEDAFVITQYNVNILPIEKEIIKTIPQGSEFFFGDEYLNLEGTYTKTFQSENGCDSIVTLHLYLEGCYANILNGDTLWVSALEDTVIQLQANNSAKYYRWSPALYIDDSTLASPTITLPIGESATYVLETMYESSVNLIENGNFEQGNVGFTSEYNYTPSSLGADGYYTIGTNPNSHHLDFSDCPQQRNILIANGSSVPNTAVYETTVDVVPNTDYAVSFEATSVLSYVLNTARFQFSVNGEMLGDIFTISDNSCQWNTYYQIWNSGNNQQATIRIINQVSAAAGNDFAIANIQFKGLCVAKDTLIVENNNVLDKRDINLCQGEVYSDYPFEDLVQNTDSLIVKEGEIKDTVYK